MRASLATAPADAGKPNEDFAGLLPRGAVLLDGSGLSGTKTLCRHGVAWYTTTLGSHILGTLSRLDFSLTQILEQAIERTADEHRDTCDLNDPGTPSSTVVITRIQPDSIDYLVLADSVLVIVQNDDITIKTDDREGQVGQRYRSIMDNLTNGTPEHDDARRQYVQKMREHRNVSDGFWVAAADPKAAQQALTGSLPAAAAQSIALLSDGASRLVDRFGLMTWNELMATLSSHGPSELIRQVRLAERMDIGGSRWPRGKTYDDATAVFLEIDREFVMS